MPSIRREDMKDDVESLVKTLEHMLDAREQNVLRRLDLISKTLNEQQNHLRRLAETSRATAAGDSGVSSAKDQDSRAGSCQSFKQQHARGGELPTQTLVRQSRVHDSIRQPKPSETPASGGLGNYDTPCPTPSLRVSGPAKKTMPRRRACTGTTELVESRSWHIEVTDSGIPAIVQEGDECDHSAQSHWRVRLNRTIRRPIFDFFWLMIIVLNSLFMGVQIQYYVTNGTTLPGNSICELTLACLYLIEFLTRLAGGGIRKLFCGPELAWSLFDVFILSMSWIDIALHYIAGQTATASSLRILLIFRILRAAKVIRGIRFLRNLRLLLVGMLNSIIAISWTAVALLVMVYLGAIVILSIVAEKVLEETPYYVLHWGNIEVSMCTLFQVMTGDSWWSVVGRGIREDCPSAVVFLLMYYCIAAYGLLNVVTGVFVEQTLNTSKNDAEILKDRSDESKRLVRAFLRDVFDVMDSDGDGRATLAEFQHALANPDIQFGLALVDLDSDDVQNLFAVFDSGGDGSLDEKEFVEGLVKMKGYTTHADLVEHNLRIKSLLEGSAGHVNRPDSNYC